ncbi:MAG: D-cysteine desulfhydrase family protein [Firmicutes bacterium]|nr:D-cysteine desulfhydrase family protein [Bacillota bacterium]
MLFSRFPRVRLTELPTPLQHLPRYGNLSGHPELYIKRDDFLALGMGGNKLRHLEFWLGAAYQQGADVIVACGRPESNQCRLTAAAAAKLGLDCILVHNTEPPTMLQGNILLSHIFGARSIYIGETDEDDRHQQALALVEELKREGRKPYLIGDVALGTLGYVNAALELHQQALAQDIDLQHVVIVGAMGGTASGFLFGTALLGRPFHVHVISVEYPKAQLWSILENNFANVGRLLEQEPTAKLADVATVYEDYLGPGYAQPTPQSIQTVYDLARTEGILLENVYTSKSVWGLRDLIARGIIPDTEPVCVFHTGGGPALFAQAELFQPR